MCLGKMRRVASESEELFNVQAFLLEIKAS